MSTTIISSKVAKGQMGWWTFSLCVKTSNNQNETNGSLIHGKEGALLWFKPAWCWTLKGCQQSIFSLANKGAILVWWNCSIISSCQLPSLGSHFITSCCNIYACCNTNRSLSTFQTIWVLRQILQAQLIVHNRRRNLILTSLWQPLGSLIHSSAFCVVSESSSVLLAMIIFWLLSRGVFLRSCSCCCSHTAWIYRWFVCDR